VGTRFKDMVKMIIKIVKKGGFEFVPRPEKYINVETGDYITDITKIKNLLKWTPKISLEEGIKFTYEFYKKYHRFYWD